MISSSIRLHHNQVRVITFDSNSSNPAYGADQFQLRMDDIIIIMHREHAERILNVMTAKLRYQGPTLEKEQQ